MTVVFAVQRPIVSRRWRPRVFIILVFLLPFSARIAFAFALLFWNLIGQGDVVKAEIPGDVSLPSLDGGSESNGAIHKC